MTFATPTGLELTRKQVPRLFALIDELTAALKAPRFHRILLTEDFNASVTQKPRLGIFGWQQNYLILGLPLMQALSPQQFRAVLAHEFGHLSGNHSRFAGWIYRVRQTYFQILQRLQESQQQGSSILFENFFGWYAPFFNAYSFVLARMNECEADRYSLDEKAQNASLTPEEAWNRAAWTAEFKGDDLAIPLLQECLTIQPNHVSANYLLG